jgi:hypothetical protein
MAVGTHACATPPSRFWAEHGQREDRRHHDGTDAAIYMQPNKSFWKFH